MRSLHALLWACTALVLLSACTQSPPRPNHADETARMSQARAHMEKESTVAVAKRGIKVCRELTIGIAERDWIRGVVIETDGGTLSVRIDDAGRFTHTIDGVAIKRGSIVRSAAAMWVPCL